MCYLMARRENEIGCVAIKVRRGEILAALVSYLGLKTLNKGIEILTVTDMDMYGEYKPYRLLSSEKEFIVYVLEEAEKIYPDTEQL